MTFDLDIPDLILKIAGIVVFIAKTFLDSKDPSTLTPEEAAAIALFNAMIAYMEAVS